MSSIYTSHVSLFLKLHSCHGKVSLPQVSCIRYIIGRKSVYVVRNIIGLDVALPISKAPGSVVVSPRAAKHANT